MPKELLTIQSIPAILWGSPSTKLYIFVHGRKSCKEDAAGFAALAEAKGFQVLSFDLPGHGSRQADGSHLTVQNAVPDLSRISDFVRARWGRLSLFASSIGAYFSLVAYPELRFEKCLFQSPILDMERLIRDMMKWFAVSEETLEQKQEIHTPMGEDLSWKYYSFVKQHPLVKWESPSYILYGSEDQLTPRSVVDAFVAKYHCHLEVLQNGEHYFHTGEQLQTLDRWLKSTV